MISQSALNMKGNCDHLPAIAQPRRPSQWIALSGKRSAKPRYRGSMAVTKFGHIQFNEMDGPAVMLRVRPNRRDTAL